MEGRRYRGVVWGEKQIMDAAEGRDPWSHRKGREREIERERNTQVILQENTSSKPLPQKARGTDFLFLQVRLKDWSFRGLWHGWYRALWALHYFCEEGR